MFDMDLKDRLLCPLFPTSLSSKRSVNAFCTLKGCICNEMFNICREMLNSYRERLFSSGFDFCGNERIYKSVN